MNVIKKNILIVGNSIAYTGAFKAALQEADSLSCDHNIIFIVPSKSSLDSILEKKGYRYYKLPMSEIGRSFKKIILYFPMLLLNMMRLKKIVEKENIEVIHVNDFYNLLGAAVKILGYKGSLITYVRLLPSARPSFLRKWWTIVAQRYSDWVICVSDAVLAEMPPRNNTIRIYNAIAFEEKIQTPVKHRTGIISLLYLSNYIHGKGQDHALYAFAKAYEKNKALRLRFTGGDMGLKKNKMFRQMLINRAGDLGVPEVVTFDGFSENVEKEIKEADIILNFSEAESFSMTCAEASYYGRPVIATRCGGPAEIIADHQSGILVDNKNVLQMAEAILELASDEKKRKDYGEFGRNFVRQKFSEKNFLMQFRQLL